MLKSLASISWVEDLTPARSGIEAFYSRQLKLVTIGRYAKPFSQDAERSLSERGAIARVLDENPPLTDEWQIEEFVVLPRLVDAVRIFTGYGIASVEHEQAAVSQCGIVAFLNILTGVSTDLQDVGRCTVLPGKIERNGRTFASVEDLSDFKPHGMDFRSREADYGRLVDPLQHAGISRDLHELRSDYVQSSLLACETSRNTSRPPGRNINAE